MSTWIGADDPGNVPGEEPRSLGELLRAWIGNPDITVPPGVAVVSSREPEAGAESNPHDRFFPKAPGPANTHPGPDFPVPQQAGKEKEAEAG